MVLQKPASLRGGRDSRRSNFLLGFWVSDAHQPKHEDQCTKRKPIVNKRISDLVLRTVKSRAPSRARKAVIYYQDSTIRVSRLTDTKPLVYQQVTSIAILKKDRSNHKLGN